MRAERKGDAFPAAALAETATLTPTQKLAQLPDYVPIINFDQFLLAARPRYFGSGNDVSPDARLAAVALSSKFAVQRPADPDRQDMGSVMQSDPVAVAPLQVPDDPKEHVQMVALENESASANEKNLEEPSIMEEATAPRASEGTKREVRQSKRRVYSSRSGAKARPSRRARSDKSRRIAEAQTETRATLRYNGSGSHLTPLVGFRSLSPDRRLTR